MDTLGIAILPDSAYGSILVLPCQKCYPLPSLFTSCHNKISPSGGYKIFKFKGWHLCWFDSGDNDHQSHHQNFLRVFSAGQLQSLLQPPRVGAIVAAQCHVST